MNEHTAEGDYDALVRLCRTVIDVHAQVVMDTSDERALHDQAIGTFRARLAQLTAPPKPRVCDHPGLDHDNGWSYCWPCPKCWVCKFIGHGPLCGDCCGMSYRPGLSTDAL